MVCKLPERLSAGAEAFHSSIAGPAGLTATDSRLSSRMAGWSGNQAVGCRASRTRTRSRLTPHPPIARSRAMLFSLGSRGRATPTHRAARSMSNLFRPALAVMETSRAPTFGPRSFQGYLVENGLLAQNTWQHISVDNLRRLAPELREANTMVFRLGSPEGEKHTHFGLWRMRQRVGRLLPPRPGGVR